jgi:hypothetical protein
MQADDSRTSHCFLKRDVSPVQKLLAAVVCLCALQVAGAAQPTAPAFSEQPAVKAAGGNVSIRFALSAPTDVEVAVISAEGQVVRHLAAGVLGGPNEPPAPLKPGLAQELVWDGKDDAGNPVPGTRAPLSVRVRAGMSMKFGRIIGTSPYTGDLGSFGNGIAVSSNGAVLLRLSANTGFHCERPWQLREFDAAGTYRRTLLPYPSSLPPDKAQGCRTIDAGDGLLTPAQRSALYPVFCSFGDELCNRVVDEQAVFADSRNGRLLFYRLDGSGALRTVPMRFAQERSDAFRDCMSAPQMALSPDGRFAYYSGVAHRPYPKANKPSDIDPAYPQGRIYRQDLTRTNAPPERFFDLTLPDWEQAKYWLPSVHNNRTAASGIDVAANGNLYVCDLVNQEVAEVAPDGRLLSRTKVPWPDKVLVARSGAFYVLSLSVSEMAPEFRAGAATLLKVVGRGAEGKVVARLPLKGVPPNSLALVDAGPTSSIWLGGERQLVRVEDQGETLVSATGNLLNSNTNAIDFVCYGDVDAEAEKVYVTSGVGPIWGFDGNTGAGGRLAIGGVDLAVGPQGSLHVWSGWHGHVIRYDRNLSPLNIPGTANNRYDASFVEGRMGRGQSVPGMDVDAQGRVYAMVDRDGPSQVIVFDLNGKLVSFGREIRQEKGKGVAIVPGAESFPALIDGLSRPDSCVRLDRAGNIYLMRRELAKDHVPPTGFAKENAYLLATGTICKFGPQGGEFTKGGEAKGLLRRYRAACGPISGTWASTGSCCTCARPRFDVDDYGRLYVPNSMTYKVTLLDNADNPILVFGGYGNWDAQGPQSAEPKPEIPLGWPVFACATDKAIYVGDTLNHRVVRADKQWAAEAVCKLP